MNGWALSEFVAVRELWQCWLFALLRRLLDTGFVLQDVALGTFDAVVGSVPGAAFAGKVAHHAFVGARRVGTECVSLLLAEVLFRLNALIDVDASQLFVHGVASGALFARLGASLSAGALARWVALGAGPGAVGTRLVFIVALGARVAQLTCVTLVAFALAVALTSSRAFAPAMPVTWVLSSSCARIAVGAIVVFRAASFSPVDAQVLVQIGLLVLMLEPPLFQVFLVLCGHVSAMLLALDYLQAEVLLDFDEPNLTFRVLPHIPGLPVDVSSIEATPFCSLNAILECLDYSLAGLTGGQQVLTNDALTQVADVYGCRKLHFCSADNTEANEKKSQQVEES